VSGEFTPAGTGPLTGPPRQWVEELTGLALEHGISAFIAGGDDPAALRTFGQEVAPAVRELVAAERAGSGGRAAPTEPDRESITAGGTASGAPGAGVTPTPAPAVRVSDRRVWDESTRPVAPPAPAGQASPARGGSAGQHLVDVHDHLRQELAQVRDVLRQVKDGAVTPGRARGLLNQMAVRQNNWTLGAYCEAYCTLITGHHGLEDGSVFPHLRRAEAGLVPVLDRLQEEHVAIHEVVEAVDRALVDLVRTPGDFTEVDAAVDLLTDALLSHLAYEEQQLVGPLARHGFYPGQF
jgi:hypothetical protein